MFTAPYTLGPVTVNTTSRQYQAYLRVAKAIDPHGHLDQASTGDLKAYNRFAHAVEKYEDAYGPIPKACKYDYFRPNY